MPEESFDDSPRNLGVRRPGQESHLKSAFRQLDQDGIVHSLDAVVVRQLLAQSRHVHTNHGFLTRIVGRRFAEGIQAKSVLLEPVRLAGERFVRQIGEQTSLDLRQSEVLILKDTLDLSPDRFRLEYHRGQMISQPSGGPDDSWPARSRRHTPQPRVEGGTQPWVTRPCHYSTCWNASSGKRARCLDLPSSTSEVPRASR